MAAAAFVPYSIALGALFGALPFFEVSAGYWPLPVLIFAYAALLRRRDPMLGRELAAGAAILCVSLAARSVDLSLCAAFPLGTHFLWHILNAIMLGWMIETRARALARLGIAGRAR